MATSDQKNASALGEQAIALAEQLGRIAGTLEGTAESWLNQQSLADQLTRVRDGAAQMLESLTGRSAQNNNSKKTKTAAPAPAVRRADPSRAAGKRRRKPAPSIHGLKKSDERIPKQRTAAAVRQRRKSHA